MGANVTAVAVAPATKAKYISIYCSITGFGRWGRSFAEGSLVGILLCTVCCRYLTGLPRLFCQQFEFALQKGLEQAPRSSAYFRNPPVLSGQAWYCSFLWAVEGSLQ